MKNYWFEQIKKVNGEEAIIGIAGNKCDLYDKEEVTEADAKAFADKNDCVFKLTSVFSGLVVKELFQELVERLVNGGQKKEETPKKEKEGNIKINEKVYKAKEKEKKCC